MSDTTKLYHFESLNKYIKSSWISEIEVNGTVYSNQNDIEKVINSTLESSLSQNFVLDKDKCSSLFSFNVPKIEVFFVVDQYLPLDFVVIEVSD